MKDHSLEQKSKCIFSSPEFLGIIAGIKAGQAFPSRFSMCLAAGCPFGLFVLLGVTIFFFFAMLKHHDKGNL